MKRFLVFVGMVIFLIALRAILSSAIKSARAKDSNIFLFTLKKYNLFVIIGLIISIVGFVI